MEMFKKRFLYLFLLLTTCLLLCGAGNKESEIVVDTQQKIVYKNMLADTLISDYLINSNTLKTRYDNKYFAIVGKVSAKEKNGKTFSIGSVNLARTTILECEADKKLKGEIASINIGDYVKVYGKVNIGLSNRKMTFELDKVEKASSLTVPDNSYSLIDGAVYASESFLNRFAGDNRFSFYIPEEWEAVETNIVDSKVGTVEGYQYSLNKLENNGSAKKTECLFVFYFDNDLLKNAGLSNRKESEKIERAIIGNILDQDGEALKEKFPLKKVTTYYGSTYHYYRDTYKDSLGQGYHTEFIFEPDGTKGIKVFLYVYNDMSHLDDILAVLRLSAKVS